MPTELQGVMLINPADAPNSVTRYFRTIESRKVLEAYFYVFFNVDAAKKIKPGVSPQMIGAVACFNASPKIPLSLLKFYRIIKGDETESGDEDDSI